MSVLAPQPGLRLLFDGHRVAPHAVGGAPRSVAIKVLACSGRLTGLTVAIGRQLLLLMRTDGYGHVDGSVAFVLGCRACYVGDCTGDFGWGLVRALTASASERRDAT